MKQKQRGITFVGIVLVGIVVALVGLLTAKVVPTYTEYLSVMKAAQKAAESGTTVAEIRASFDKTRAVDYFDAVAGKDLVIGKVNDRVVVEFAYDKEIHLAGPAYLVMKYRGKTE